MSAMQRPSRGTQEVGWLVLVLLAVVAGAWLRWYQLGDQILIDDEWHAIIKLLHAGYWNIFRHFGRADYCIPLTLYDRFLFEHGGLSEWGLRLPMLLSSVALLIVAAPMLRGWADRSARALTVALLAVSPVLVYLGKTARPYALTSLTSFIALIAFRRWFRGHARVRAWAAAYVAATFAGGWLHLLTLCFTLAPFVYYGGRAMLDLCSNEQRARGADDMRRLVKLGCAVTLPLALVLLPPLLVDWQALAVKASSNTHAVSLESLYRTLLMMLGIASPALCALLMALAGLGAIRLWRDDADRASYLGFTLMLGSITIILARPDWIEHPGVLTRYALPALPFMLLAIAAGATWLLRVLRPPFLRAALAIPAVAGLVMAGPLPAYLYKPNQFMGHPAFQFDYDPAHNPVLALQAKQPIPAFYRLLAQQRPGSLTVVETPWLLESTAIIYWRYQRLDRQYVKIGLSSPLCGDRTYGDYPASVAALDLHQFVHLSSLLAGQVKGLDYLVVRTRPWATAVAAQLRFWPDMRGCVARIRDRFGAPVYRDDEIEVFDLAPGTHPPLPALSSLAPGAGGATKSPSP